MRRKKLNDEQSRELANLAERCRFAYRFIVERESAKGDGYTKVLDGDGNIVRKVPARSDSIRLEEMNKAIGLAVEIGELRGLRLVAKDLREDIAGLDPGDRKALEGLLVSKFGQKL